MLAKTAGTARADAGHRSAQCGSVSSNRYTIRPPFSTMVLPSHWRRVRRSASDARRVAERRPSRFAAQSRDDNRTSGAASNGEVLPGRRRARRGQPIGVARRPSRLVGIVPSGFEPPLVCQASQDGVQRSRAESGDLTDGVAVVPGSRRLKQQRENQQRLRRGVGSARHIKLYISIKRDASGEWSACVRRGCWQPTSLPSGWRHQAWNSRVCR